VALRRLNLQGNELLAEIGCGTGLNMKALAHGAGKVIALDHNSAMLKRAPRKFDNVSYVLGTPSVLADDSVDVVLLSLVLNIADDWHAVLEDCKRIVKPGGRIVIADVQPLRGVFRCCNFFVVPIANWSGAGDIRRNIWSECSELECFGGGYFAVGTINC
jgi:ubiquinone/menaquinone biosynthesis C-methylase UbiE